MLINSFTHSVGSIFVGPSQCIVETRLNAADHGGKVCCIVLLNIVLSCDGPKQQNTPPKTRSQFFTKTAWIGTFIVTFSHPQQADLRLSSLGNILS